MSIPSTTPNRGERPSQDRCKPVTVRFTPFEHQQLMQAAAETGRSASDLIRETAAGITIHARPPAINHELLKELAAWGNNLNQITHKINSGNTPSTLEIMRAIEDCHQALDMIGLRMAGSIVDDN